jgi:hypothetical protein
MANWLREDPKGTKKFEVGTRILPRLATLTHEGWEHVAQFSQLLKAHHLVSAEILYSAHHGIAATTELEHMRAERIHDEALSQGVDEAQIVVAREGFEQWHNEDADEGWKSFSSTRRNVCFRPIADISGYGHLAPMADHCCASKGQELEKLARQADSAASCIIVLVINAVMFFLEFGAGIVAGSTALMADATDMLGDALVYWRQHLCPPLGVPLESGCGDVPRASSSLRSPSASS